MSATRPPAPPAPSPTPPGGWPRHGPAPGRRRCPAPAPGPRLSPGKGGGTMASRPRPLGEQSVIVFGGTSGIGLAAARAFSGAGASVTVVGRDPARGEAAATGIGGRFEQADCADGDAVAAAVARTVAAAGRIDTALVTLGGTVLPELLFRQNAGDIAAALAGDLLPVLLSAHAVLGAMMAAGGGTILT